jgi:hypothetical protein
MATPVSDLNHLRSRVREILLSAPCQIDFEFAYSHG